MALDGFRTYGVKQVPKSTKDGGGLTWMEFKELVRQLEHREATGNTAKQIVQQACDEADMSQWNDWYRRILIKDLRCGVTHKTVNKHSTMKVPVFECMLADDSKKHEKKMVGEVLIEPKLDGVRVVAILDVDKDEVKIDYFFPDQYFQDRIYSVLKKFWQTGKVQTLAEHVNNKGDNPEIVQSRREQSDIVWEEARQVLEKVSKYMICNDFKLPVERNYWMPQIQSGDDEENRNKFVQR